MDNPQVQRVLIITAIVISALVAVLSFVGIVGVWLANPPIANFVIGLSTAVEKSAQAMERSVQRANTGIENLRDQVDSVHQAVAAVSQNVADDGLVRQLLPESTETRLDNAIGNIVEVTTTVRDSVNAALDLYQSVNRIPFVSLPAPDPATVDKVTTGVSEIKQDIQDLKDGIAQIRAKQAAAISRVNTVTERVNTRLDNVQTELNQFNDTLSKIETAAKQIRSGISLWLAIIALVITLIFGWVIFTQVVFIRMMWARYLAQSAETAHAA